MVDYDRAIKLKPNYAEVYLNRGNIRKHSAVS
ncbi:MAG: tetratricopeptide repeat protein [Okeania sp. SIO2F4]|nr:tetratricopeptide repeat protein [Okeania sp. SIO2F4]